MAGISNYIKETRSVYPGEYQPLSFDTGVAGEEPGESTKGDNGTVATVIDCDDHYKIEIEAPGHTKDDFIVTVDKERMYVFAIKKRSKDIDLLSSYSPGLNYDCFEHSVALPGNIDTDFLRAEYKDDLLSVCFPKTGKPVLNTLHPVVVY